MRAVTLLAVDEHTIIQKKTEETDGYNAFAVGTETAKHPGKSLKGHAKLAKVLPRIIREFKVDNIAESLNVGEKFSSDVFISG